MAGTRRLPPGPCWRFLAFCLLLLARPGAADPAAPQSPAPPMSPPAEGPLPVLATAVARQANLEGRVLWMDGTANLKRLSTREGVAAVFDKCKQANINTVVVDVKPLGGQVLYNSTVAPQLREWKGLPLPRRVRPAPDGRAGGPPARHQGLREHQRLQRRPQAAQGGPALREAGTRRPSSTTSSGPSPPPDGASCDACGRRQPRPRRRARSAPTTAGFPDAKTLGPEDAAVVVRQDQRQRRPGRLAERSWAASPFPTDGYLLVGRGDGRRWLLEHLQVGRALTYTAKEVLQPILEAPSRGGRAGSSTRPTRRSRAYALTRRRGACGQLRAGRHRLRPDALLQPADGLLAALAGALRAVAGQEAGTFPAGHLRLRPDPGTPDHPGPLLQRVARVAREEHPGLAGGGAARRRCAAVPS